MGNLRSGYGNRGNRGCHDSAVGTSAADKAAYINGCAKTTLCAIYTRKTTEEGLEQVFNSLDAQREACAAYIASQRHERWVTSPNHGMARNSSRPPVLATSSP